MKITITTAASNVYLIASRTTPVDGVGVFHGRLLNELTMGRVLSSVGSFPAVLNISVRNDDLYIPRSENLWAATVEIESDSGYEWSGKITAYDSDASGVLYLVATERAAPELTIQIPDEVARLVTVDENFHVSALNVTLPLVIGGNSTKPILVRGILVDKINGVYLLCVGEIHQVVKVYRGTEELSTGFTAYTGATGQASYPGFAYVQIDEDLRQNDDGSYAEISADVIGLKLGASTIEECRNGARFLQYFLKTASTGVGGWGLGISEDDIDSTAFTTAISRVDTAGLKLDGTFYFRQPAQAWIDQICQAVRGSYEIGDGGLRRLFVNASASSAKTYTQDNIKLLRDGRGAYTGQVYNKGKLDFDYNPLTSQFMQSAQYEDPTSIAAIGEQEFYGQSYLIKDAATAQAILEYNCKKSLIGADKVLFETDELAEGCRVGDIITLAHTTKGLTGTYQITSLEIGDYLHTIEAEKYSTDIFTVGTPGTAIEWVRDANIASTITPGAPSGLNLSSEIRPSPDGTNIVVLKGTFTPPAGKYFAAVIDYGEDAEPATWIGLGLVQGNSFEIAPVKPAQTYAVRIKMTTSTGHSDYVTGTITTQGDTVPPGAPSIGVSSYLKTVTLQMSLGTVPSDMAGFTIYRHTANNSAAAPQIGSVSSKDGKATYVDEAPEYGVTYYYWVKSFDTWGNRSAFSDVALTLITAINGADIVDAALNRSELFQAGVVDAAAISAAALKQAGGAVAAWSAQNCTTASIAEAGGVIDVSGNGNHGTAVGGVDVVSSDNSAAFRFDAAGECIIVPDMTFSDYHTIAFWYKGSQSATYRALISRNGGSYYHCLISDSHNRFLGFYVSGFVSSGYAIQDDTLYHIAIIAKASDTWSLYVNGAFVITLDGFWDASTIPLGAIGNSGVVGPQPANGVVSCPRVYPRALTATEIKTLYMFPGDVAFARVTADFMAANSVVAESIVSGAVTTPKLAAGSVTMEKLLVGAPGAALNDDPGFQDASSWTTVAADAVNIVTISDGIVGNQALRGYSNGTGNHYRSKKLTPSDINKSYRVSALARKNGAPTNNFFLGLYEFDSSGSLLGTTLHYDQYNVACDSLTTSFVRHAVIITPAAFNANTRFISLSLILGNTTTGGYVEVQDGRVEEVLPATLIQDGAITTDKINVAGLNASVIKAGSLDAARIATGSLHADKLTSGTIAAEQLSVQALKAPSGAVAAWSAKGSTTASIALAGGVKDVSGNGKHGTASGGVSIVATDMGQAMRFGNGKMVVAAIGGYTGASVTVAGWFKISGAIGAGVANRKTLFAFRPWSPGLWLAGDMIRAHAGIGSVNATYCDAAWTYDNNWHLIGLVYDQSSQTVAVILDGQIVPGAQTAFAPGMPDGNFLLGNESNDTDYTYSFPGDIAGFRVYSRALTAAEVKTLYMLGADSESGTITADRVVTGQIKSLNYSTTAGSMIDLDAGDVKMGGSSAPRFSFTNSTNTGVFAGFAFNATDLTAGTGTAAVGMSTDAAKKLIWAGNTIPANAPFYVTNNGDLKAAKAIVGAITCESSVMAATSSTYNYTFQAGMAGATTDFYPGVYLKSDNETTATIVDIGVDDSGLLRNGSTTAKALIKAQVGATSYYAFYTNGRIYIGDNCSAGSFTDRTAMPESIEDALEIINTMQAKDGKVDYDKLSKKAKRKAIHKKDDGTEEIEEGRNLTLTVSALVMVNQKQQSEIAELQKQLAEIMEKLKK